MADEEVYPINLLMEELKNEDTEVRIKSMQRLKTVAQALGPEKTRDELIPFLNTATEDEDEILASLAIELGEFVPLIGGPSHASILLEPLETLAGVEETVVRDKAVASIKKIAAVMDTSTESFVPILKRLTEGDWFTYRVSACPLFPVVYPKIQDENQKSELRDMYQVLCGDDTPMVRRAAASSLGAFAEVLEKDQVINGVMDLFRSLSTDDQDSVRLLCIENCTSFAKILSEEENMIHVLPVVRASVEDRSWRVKFSVAKEFFPISQAMGEKITKEELLGSFLLLLRDSEAEVRAASTKNLAGYADIIGKDIFLNEILHLLDELSKDVAPNVRTEMAIAIMELAPKLGQDVTKRHLLPMILGFLRDETVDVRLNVLKRLDKLAVWMPALESSLLPAVAELARDLQWRVREAVILTFPALAENLGAEYFEIHLLEMYLSSFTDMVGQVRTAASSILKDMLGAVGSEWILEKVLPKLISIYDNSQLYQERVNVLHATRVLACEAASSNLLAELTKLAVRGSRDKIPNVRFSASLCLEQLAKHLDPAMITSEVRPCLGELQNDQDDDVKYYSSVALESVAS